MKLKKLMAMSVLAPAMFAVSPTTLATGNGVPENACPSKYCVSVEQNVLPYTNGVPENPCPSKYCVAPSDQHQVDIVEV